MQKGALGHGHGHQWPQGARGPSCSGGSAWSTSGGVGGGCPAAPSLPGRAEAGRRGLYPGRGARRCTARGCRMLPAAALLLAAAAAATAQTPGEDGCSPAREGPPGAARCSPGQGWLHLAPLRRAVSCQGGSGSLIGEERGLYPLQGTSSEPSSPFVV